MEDKTIGTRTIGKRRTNDKSNFYMIAFDR